MKIDRETAEAAVLGGAVLGGGGGGWVEEGRTLAQLSLDRGFSEICSIEELPSEAVLLTVSAVGAPSAGSSALDPQDYIRAVELFREKARIKIDGLISSEIGALGVVNGWLQSAALKIPVVDAPCNGRAHPLGQMGSMGLAKDKNYVSQQAAVGGGGGRGRRVEAFLEGPLTAVSKSVREAAAEAGGIVAVARNPVPVHFVQSHGAPGAVQTAVELGRALLSQMEHGIEAEKKIRPIAAALKAKLVTRAMVGQVDIKTEGGLDVGRMELRAGRTEYEVTFWNEYMTFEREGARLATFPDLIMTFKASTGMPLISAQVKKGDEVFIITAPSQNLILGAGMRDAGLLEDVEKAIGKGILGQRQ